jgi:hypothetical protein
MRKAGISGRRWLGTFFPEIPAFLIPQKDSRDSPDSRFKSKRGLP